MSRPRAPEASAAALPETSLHETTVHETTLLETFPRAGLPGVGVPGARLLAAGFGATGRFARSRTGIAAVEFALILPFMATLYLGMAELTRAVGNSRKLTVLARTLADLTARGGLATNNLAEIFTAGGSVLAPYKATGVSMVISSFGVTKVGGAYQAKVCWSRGWKNGAQLTGAPVLATGATSTAPVGYEIDQIRFIRVDVAQTYTPMVGSNVISYATGGGTGTLNLADQTVWPVRANEKKNASNQYPEVLLPDGTGCT